MMRPVIFLIAVAFLWLNPALKAQNSLEAYLDIGKDQVSQGFYSQISNTGCFEKAIWGIQAGYSWGWFSLRM
jgi:hypothetical protein